MNLIQKILASLRKTPTFTGALLPIRAAEERVESIHHEDIVGTSAAVMWTENKTVRSFPQYNQKRSSMCGANALAKALGISYGTSFGDYVPFSRADIYQRRINKPYEGMYLADMLRIAEEGVTLEQLTPKDINYDSDADGLTIEPFKREVGKVFSSAKGIYLPSDIETIASVIQQTGKGVILLTYFLPSEWSLEIPTIQNKNLGVGDLAALRHYVVATDFKLIEGKKYLKVEDSAAFGGFYDRWISEEWISKRVYAAAYVRRFKFQEKVGDKPSYDGQSIVSLQKCLRYEGLFPVGIDFVESLGPLTRKSLGEFQKKTGLPISQRVDDATRKEIHRLYP